MPVATSQRAPRRRPSTVSPPPGATRRTGYLIGLAIAWAIVLLLWSGRVLRAGGAVVFWLAVTAALVHVVGACIELARDEDGLAAARKATVLVLLVLVPLAFDPTTSESFSVAKYAALVVGALVLAGLWVVEGVRRRGAPRWRNGLQWPVLALLAWTVVATAASSDHRLSLLGYYSSYDGLYTAAALAAVFFAVTEAVRPGDVGRVLSAVYFAAGGVIALYGLLQLHDVLWGGHWDWVNWGEASFSGKTIWSSLGNPNHLAGFFATLLPIGAALALWHRRLWIRALIAIIAAAAVAEIVHTQARGAWVGALAGLIAVAAFLLREVRVRPLVAGAAVAAGVLVAVGVAAATPSLNLRSRVASVTEFGSTSVAAQRGSYWDAAWRMARDRPITGAGPDVYPTLFPSYQTSSFVRVYGPDELTNGPHNIFMDELAGTGFLGLALFVAVLALAGLRGRGAWKRLRQIEQWGPERERPEARARRLLLAGVLAALIAYVVQASFDVFQVALAITFWGLLAVLCVIAAGAGVPDTLAPAQLLAAPRPAAEPEEERIRPPRPAARPARAPRSMRRAAARSRRHHGTDAVEGRVWLTALLALAAVAVLGFVASGPYRADHSYKRATQFEAGADQVAASDPRSARLTVERAITQYNRAAAANRSEARYPEGAARLRLIMVGRGLTQPGAESFTLLDEARKGYRRALQLAPRNVSILQGYAEVLLTIDAKNGGNDPASRAAAIAALRRAIDANPWHAASYDQLGLALESDHQDAAALATFERGLTYAVKDLALLRHGARLETLLHRDADAARLWRRLLVVDPGDPEAVAALRGKGPG